MPILSIVSWLSLAIAFLCAIIIAADELRHPQKRWIMNIVAEFSIFGLGLTLFGKPIFAEYVGDLFLAWLLGIAFQYFTIQPMRNLSAGKAVSAAVKADTLSILTFEIGLFAWMRLTYFVFFPHPRLTPKDSAYWFMMQTGMVLGYFTSYPMNRLLIKMGWKEAMG